MIKTELTRNVAIFYCYAHEDAVLLNELVKHLGVLKHQGQISGWHDRDIQAGKEWRHEVDTQLNIADIILLLVSPDFIHSEYCYAIMHQALERHRAGQAHVLPVILRPVDWKKTPITELQVLPANEKPITKWRNRDEALEAVAIGIRTVVETLFTQQLREQRKGEDHISLLTHIEDASTAPKKQITQLPYEIINTEGAIHLFHEIMQPESPKRLLRLVGRGKMGKSHLLTYIFPGIASQVYQARCLLLDLRNPMYKVSDYLGIAVSQLDSQVRESFDAAVTCIEDNDDKNYHLTTYFVKELSKLDGSLLLLVDSIDSAKEEIQGWLMDLLLTQLSQLSQVRIVLAGRSLPEVHPSYAGLCHPASYQLHEVMDLYAYIEFCHSVNARVDEHGVRALARAFDYIPGLFAEIIRAKFMDEGRAHG